jgi:hypothetical protein
MNADDSSAPSIKQFEVFISLSNTEAKVAAQAESQEMLLLLA